MSISFAVFIDTAVILVVFLKLSLPLLNDLRVWPVKCVTVPLFKSLGLLSVSQFHLYICKCMYVQISLKGWLKTLTHADLPLAQSPCPGCGILGSRGLPDPLVT